MSEVIIRPAVLSDVEEYVRCAVGLFSEDAGSRDSTVSQDWPYQHAGESFERGVADPTRLLLVAESDGAVVGALSGAIGEPTAVRPIVVAGLMSLYVIPPLRSQGVGARLVDGFKEWAASQGAQRMSVSAYASNQNAIRFYQRMGFVPFENVLEASVARSGGLWPHAGDVVRGHVAAFDAGDVAQVVAGFAEDAVFVTGSTVVCGREALREFFDAAIEGLSPTLLIDELVVSGEQVACQLTEVIESGSAERRFSIAGFYRVCDGLIVRGKIYREGDAGWVVS